MESKVKTPTTTKRGKKVFTVNTGIGGYNLSEMLNLFLQDLTHRTVREATITYYKGIIRTLERFTDVENVQSHHINQDWLQSFITHCKTVFNHSEGTININMRGIRSILYWLMKEEHIEQFKIVIPSANTAPKACYTDTEIKALLTYPNFKTCSFPDLTAWTATAIFVYTGARLSSVVNMRIQDVDMFQNVIFFQHTKNKQPLVVPIATELKKILTIYLKSRISNNAQPSERLLINAYGDEHNRNSLYKCMAKFNLSRSVTRTDIHSYRRYFIKSLVLKGVQPVKIAQLVGHSDINLIMQYSKLYPQELQNVVDLL